MKPKQPHNRGTRAGLYVRFARDEGSPNSVAAQQASVEDFCRAQGLDVSNVYADVGSGIDVELPGLQRALSDARGNRFDVLVVERLHRLSRRVGGIAEIIDQFMAAGVPVQTLDGFYSASPAGMLMQHVMNAFDELEIELRRERAREGRRWRKAARESCGSTRVPTTEPTDREEEHDGEIDS